MSISLNLLSDKKNSKLGKTIQGFSLPAVLTCPGRTAACENACYARKGHFARPAVKAKHLDNLRVSKLPEFVPRMIAEIRHADVDVIRISVSGDLYNLSYIRRWIKIVRACPETKFYAYTRSWRVPALLPALITLGREPNMRLWLSTDRETGAAPRIRGLPQAYLQLPGEELPKLPKGCKLIFRDEHKTVLKQVGAAVVCPVESGVKYAQPMTCSRCKLCWKEKMV